MMNPQTIGFIGFGEAAFHISSGLRTESVLQIYAFDTMTGDAKVGPLIRERAEAAKVGLTSSLYELLQKADLIVCATSARYALSIAREAAPFLRECQIYADLNSTSPRTKQEIAQVLKPTGALFVDVAVMELVPPHRHKVPMSVSGDGARRFKELLDPYGMQIAIVNERAGSASAFKMLRSIFMKGLTALLLETLTAGRKAGIDREIMASISGTIGKQPFEMLANLLLTRTAVAAERRAVEMGEVISTLQDMGLDASASAATRSKLLALADLNLKTLFNYKPPEHYSQVLDAILRDAERKPT